MQLTIATMKVPVCIPLDSLPGTFKPTTVNQLLFVKDPVASPSVFDSKFVSTTKSYQVR